MQETAILNLRLNKGIDLDQFEDKHHSNVIEMFSNAIQSSISDKLLLLTNNTLALTDKGRLLSNEVFVRIMNESESMET